MSGLVQPCSVIVPNPLDQTEMIRPEQSGLVDEVAGPGFLGGEVAFIMRVGFNHQRHALRNTDPGILNLADLVGVIGEQADRLIAELAQHFSGRHEKAVIGFKPELMVGINRIQPAILKGVGLELIDQPDITAFLRQIDQDTAIPLRHLPDCLPQLGSAIAFQAAEDITRDAL